MFETYKPFLPESSIDGHIGFYPTTNEEWKTLPLPLRCATWYRSDIESVIFDTWFSNYGIKATVEVHPQDAFKAIFTLSDGGTQLYSIVGVRTKDGKRLGAKWFQDTTSGAFGICFNGGDVIAKQGGYQAHMPGNCYKDENGKWMLTTPKDSDAITRYCLV